MKLYYSPGACSLAVHILLNETGIDYQLIKVDLASRTTETGERFSLINPKGYVPALLLDDGSLMTETAVLLQYLAERSQQSQLLPLPPDPRRYQILQWLNFLTTEIHKNFGPLFNPRLPANCREFFLNNLAYRFKTLQHQLSQSDYLAGDAFSILDPYLFTMLSWCRLVDLDLNLWPELARYRQRLSTRPAIQQALAQEELGGL